MRRKKQLLSKEDAEAVLKRNTCGVLAVLGDEGYPYAVPLSYAYEGSAFYFHSAKEGHKLEALRRCAKASFCVVDKDEVVPEKYTTLFRSVIAFGEVSLLEGDEARKAAERLAKRYAPHNTEDQFRAEMDSGFPRAVFFKLTVRHITGKEAVELVERAK